MHATADGVVVVLHDARVDRTTDGSGAVSAMTLEAVRRLDAGHRFQAPDGSFPHRGTGCRIPTLAELLEAHPETPLNIEIKQDAPAIEDAVLAVLDRFDARERTLLAAEHASIMTRIRRAAPGMLTSHSAAEVAEFVGRLQEGRLAGYRPPGVAFQVPPSYEGTAIVTARFVEAAHRLETEVHVWTIDDEAEMHWLLDLGVDGLMTDFPALGMRVLRERGVR